MSRRFNKLAKHLCGMMKVPSIRRHSEGSPPKFDFADFDFVNEEHANYLESKEAKELEELDVSETDDISELILTDNNYNRDDKKTFEDKKKEEKVDIAFRKYEYNRLKKILAKCYTGDCPGCRMQILDDTHINERTGKHFNSCVLTRFACVWCEKPCGNLKICSKACHKKFIHSVIKD